MRGALVMVALGLVAVGCSGDGSSEPGSESGSDSSAPTGEESVSTADTGTIESPGNELLTTEGFELPPSPEVPTGPTSAELLADVDALFDMIDANEYDSDVVLAVGDHGDLRVAWVLADLLRFVASPVGATDIAGAFLQLTEIDLLESDTSTNTWKSLNDHLIGWDVPAFDEYPIYKERLFTQVERGWTPFFADPGSTLDWRFVTWGGVFIDNRPLGELNGCPRGCIPALDDPPVTGADEGDWYPDEAFIFGVEINGEVRAYPKNIMEVHEMVNDTLGGRRIGMPYCTLCGSAQVYFTDSVPDGVEQPVLRTSGLLTRSNKIMYDIVSGSVFDTFTGEARSGPLREAGVILEQVTVVTSRWGDWKQAHPETTIIARDGGVGRTYDIDPLGGRDDAGPIFPVGTVDQRLDVQEPVIGVIAASGTAIAFPAGTARLTLEAGDGVEAHGVHLELDGGGLRATDDGGAEIVAHQAFWFAWSQFHPETEVWSPA